MSRIGRAPIKLLDGVKASVDGNKLIVTGPLGTLTQTFDSVKVEITSDEILVKRNSDDNEVKAKHGLYRALFANMVKGVKEGFTKNLQIKGVGYKAVKTSLFPVLTAL